MNMLDFNYRGDYDKFWTSQIVYAEPGGYSSMIWVGTWRFDLKSRPIFIPNFAEKWDPFSYQSLKF